MLKEKKWYISRLFVTYTEIHSKWITDSNVNPKTIKLLKEKIGENFCDLGWGKYYLYTIVKARPLKEKKISLNFTKINNFCSLKDTIKKMKIQARD